MALNTSHLIIRWFPGFFFLLLIGCTPVNIIATITPLSTIQPRPDYIAEISPPENSSIPISIYELSSEKEYGIQVYGLRDSESGFASTICIDVELLPLVQSGDDFRLEQELLSRMQLTVNDVKLSFNDNQMLFRDPEVAVEEPFQADWLATNIICWDAPLDVGTHLAQFRFQQSSGEMKSYSWYFSITEE